MATWKKVIVSGSAAQLSQLSVDTNVNITGSLNASSSVFLKGLTSSPQATILSIDATTGQLFYQGTGSFTANSASYALSASYASNASTADSATSASRATSAASADTATSASYASNASTSDSATSASYASNASTADSATSASRATSAANADNATSASFAATGNGTFSGSFSGSFQGDGSGLTNVPASGIVGLQLNQIGSGSVTASIAPDLGFRVNTNSQITGSLIVTGNINTGGSVISTGATSQLTGSFTGSFAGVASLPSLTQGKGITAFTYDGSTPDSVEISGSVGLSANTVTKWTGDAFANSSITDSTNVTINNAGGVLVQTGGLYVTGSSTFHDSVVVQGNLTVQGTASFQHSDNLAIADQFILLNSGSTTFEDSGIIISTGNSGNSGSAFFLETAGTTTGTDSLNGRFAVAGNVLPNATTVTAEEYANTTIITGSAPGNAVPQFGGTGLGQGNTWVDTSTSDIWIYA